MDHEEIELLNKLKDFDISTIYSKGSYIDIHIQDFWRPAYIYKVKPNNKFDIEFNYPINQIRILNDISTSIIGFFGENQYMHKYDQRPVSFNQELLTKQPKEVLQSLNIKLKKYNIDLSSISEKNNNNGKKGKNNKEANKENQEKEMQKADNTTPEKNKNEKINNNESTKQEKENQEKGQEPKKSQEILEKETPKKEALQQQPTTKADPENSSPKSQSSPSPNKSPSSQSNILRVPDKTGSLIDLTGYYTYQFLAGYLLDILYYINQEIQKFHKDHNFRELLSLSLDVIIYVALKVRQNLSHLKVAMYNRKLIIVSQVHAILCSFELVFQNFVNLYQYDFSGLKDISERLKTFATTCYQILIDNKEKNAIPLQPLGLLINFLANDNVKEYISNYSSIRMGESFGVYFENISEYEIKNLKINAKEYCLLVASKLFESKIKKYFNQWYYNYLVKCLRCKILEKKMNALNELNEIILDIMRFDNDKEEPMVYEFFIEKNKILDMFFEESVHDEILKRSSEIFKYLASYDKLSEEVMEKLIKGQNNELIKNILCEVVSELSNNNKIILFNKLTKGLNFDENPGDIEYVSKLTESCFSLSAKDYKMRFEQISKQQNLKKNKNENNKEKDDKNDNNKLGVIKGVSILDKKNNTSKNEQNNEKNENNENNNLISHDDSKEETTKEIPISEQVKDIINEVKAEENSQKNYFGFNILFDYIIKEFNDKKPVDKNNVPAAIEAFNRIIPQVNSIDSKDVEYFMDKLFENIKENPKHNSVVQSLILIHKLLDKFEDITDTAEAIRFLELKYDIISLLVKDLERYINYIEKEKKIEKVENNEIYEGIYTHLDNVAERLNLIFVFGRGDHFNFMLKIKSKEHLEKIYHLFKDKKYFKEMRRFLICLTKNIRYISSETLETFFRDILQNPEEFDLSSFDDMYTFNIITECFYTINLNKNNIVHTGKEYKVVSDKLIGLDMLFEILTKNKSSFIQNEIASILRDLCLNIKNYDGQYWKNYMEKITSLLIENNEKKDYKALSGLIGLIDMIYNLSNEFKGKIPIKEDVHTITDNFYLYQFFCKDRKHKEYKLRVGEKDKIFEIRWKLGYYYDIAVNEVVFADKNGKQYSFINDDMLFAEAFPFEIYCKNDAKLVPVKVLEIPDILLSIKNNPKELIEKDEKLFGILMENLSQNVYQEMKPKIWNIIESIPKNFHIDGGIKMLFEENKIEENKIELGFNVSNIYLLVYNLQFILQFLKENKENKEKKEKFLETFINVHHGDEIIFKTMMETKIKHKENNINNNENGNNNKNESDDDIFIYFDCFKVIFELLSEVNIYNKQKIFEYNEKNENKKKILNYQDLIEKIGINPLFNKLSEIIIDILKIKVEINSDVDFQKVYLNCCGLLSIIINFINEIKANNESDCNYLKYLLTNQDTFKEIFLFNYMTCKVEEMTKILHQYFIKNIFEDQKLIKVYLEIMLTTEVFNYLIQYDIDGSYFQTLSSVMMEYYFKNKENEKLLKKEKKEDNKKEASTISPAKETTPTLDSSNIIESKYIESFKKIIDLIINHISTECENTLINSSNNQEGKTDGIISFLQSILNLSPSLLVPYLLSQVNILDLFLNKCIQRKCVLNPLETKQPLCQSPSAQNAVFQLLIFLLKNNNFEADLEQIKKFNNDNLYQKIKDRLDEFHKIGFWKSNSPKDWDLETSERYSNKFIGLKNMSSTCYMNSILQQFFMIPMLRETILSIPNKSGNLLFQLQLLFSALKCYEAPFYDPKNFVKKSGLSFFEQMDADEYFGNLIDKIENDIKVLYPEEKKNDNNKEKDEISIESISTEANDKEKKVINPYKDLFKFFFGIQALDELKFVDCGHKRYNEFFYSSIQLEVKGFSDIHSSLKNYFKTEIMDGENKINCEECNIKRTCHKKQIFKSLPNILVVDLKRFEFDYDTMLKYKLNNFFEFPFELDMKDYLIENHTEKNTKYELTGITIHFGVSECGHYYDLIRASNGKWYKFNDTSVTEFPKCEIPREAFGEGEEEDDDFYKDFEVGEGGGKNNAYILFYTKKDFMEKYDDNINEKNIKNSEENKNIKNINNDDNKENNKENICKYSCSLKSPPYDNFSNVSKEVKNIINYQLFKYWTLENILAPNYQFFIINLLKIDLVQNIDMSLEKIYPEFFKNLKIEGFLPCEKNKNKSTNNEIFLFALRYIFTVFLRITVKQKEKNYLATFRDIIKLYIESDKDKARYILEEFSDENIISEYLVFCPSMLRAKIVCDIVLSAFNSFSKKGDEKSSRICYKFINTFVLYIGYNINSISIEMVNFLFIEIIHSDEKYILYLKGKNLEKWVMSFFNGDEDEEDDEIYSSNLLTEKHFPKLKGTHSILSQKTLNFKGVRVDRSDEGKGNEKDEEGFYDAQFMARLKDTNGNYTLIKQLYSDFKMFDDDDDS